MGSALGAGQLYTTAGCIARLFLQKMENLLFSAAISAIFIVKTAIFLSPLVGTVAIIVAAAVISALVGTVSVVESPIVIASLVSAVLIVEPAILIAASLISAIAVVVAGIAEGVGGGAPLVGSVLVVVILRQGREGKEDQQDGFHGRLN